MIAPMASPLASSGTPSQDKAAFPVILAPIAMARFSVSSTSMSGSRVRMSTEVKPSPSGNVSTEEKALFSKR
jgi:hypothetical protein